MDGYVSFTQKFTTEYVDFDFHDDLRLSSYLNMMQEAAGNHANELGCGSRFLWPRNWGFIVTNNYLEIYRPVGIGEEITLETWPLPPRYINFERHYDFRDAAGRQIAAAVSRWCLIDLNAQRFLPASALTDQDFSRYNPKKVMDFRGWKLPAPDVSAADRVLGQRICSSDCDHYRHANNTRYADYCFNCFSLAELEDRRIRSFHIVYESQCMEGEDLILSRVPCGEGAYAVSAAKEGGERAMTARIVFSGRE